MKPFTYRLVLLVVCLMGLTAYAAACNIVKGKEPLLEQSAVTSQAGTGYHHPIVAFENAPAGAACNLAQPTHNLSVGAYHRTHGFAVAFAQPSTVFSFAVIRGKSQLLHIFPFHNFW